VRASVAQAAMIGNPVSMPRVIQLVETYNELAGRERVFFIQVTEQAIMDWQLRANRNGHIACTHGGECLAGLYQAVQQGVVTPAETAVVDATAHALKFAGFQELYFENRFPAEFDIVPDGDLINAPKFMSPPTLEKVPAPGRPLQGEDLNRFLRVITEAIATDLKLRKKTLGMP